MFLGRKYSLLVNLLLVWLILPFGAKAQSAYEPYEFPMRRPADYNYRAYEEYERMLNHKTVVMSRTEFKRFSERSVFGKERMLRSGQVYMGLYEYESYLKEVYYKVYPTAKEELHDVFIGYNPYFNAFTIFDGTVKVNIGLLAEIEDEAGLAVILGHEAAHYEQRDVLRDYYTLLGKHDRKDRNEHLDLGHEFAHKSREQETKADSIGYLMAAQAGYDLRSGMANFIRYLDVERAAETNLQPSGLSQVKKSETEDDESLDNDALRSHPLTKERIALLDSIYIPSLNPEEPKRYIVSEEKFKALRAYARCESLRLLAERNENSRCAELAFKYYLQEPENETYLYHLLESIRRLGFEFKDLGQKLFLADRYTEQLNDSTGILGQLDLLYANEDFLSQINIDELIDQSVIEFKTYHEAFEFFAKRIPENSSPEFLLTQALYYYKDSERSKAFLLEYRAMPDAKHKDFAKALGSKKLMKSMRRNNEHLVLVNNIEFVDGHYWGFHHNQIKGARLSPKYYETLDRIFKNRMKGITAVYLERESDKDLAALQTYKNLFSTANVIRSQHSYTEEEEEEEVEEEPQTIQSGTTGSGSTGVKKKKKGDVETIIFSELVPSPKQEEEEDLSGVELDESLFLMKPDLWEFCVDRKIGQISFVQAIGYTDQVALTNEVMMMTILLPYYLYVHLYPDGGHMYGSNIYGYYVNVTTLDVKELSFKDTEHTVNYKMTRRNLANTLYHAIQNNLD